MQISAMMCRILKEMVPFFLLAVDWSGKKKQEKFWRASSNEWKGLPSFLYVSHVVRDSLFTKTGATEWFCPLLYHLADRVGMDGTPSQRKFCLATQQKQGSPLRRIFC
jgi:hypothetical protein